MRVLVAGWVGSTNLGDELVLAGFRHLSAHLGLSVHALSRDPAATTTTHGVPATADTDLTGSGRIVRSAHAVVFGGGGLVQDETSPFNLPYHLSRVWGAQLARVPWAGLGLGVGPLSTRLGRTLAGTLRRAVAVSVRDRPSAELLAQVGVPGAVPAADLALHLPRPRVEVEDVVTVSLRPWAGSGASWLPVGLRRTGDATPDWFLDRAARALDDIATRTGLGVRLVALQTDRDHELHQRVAERMTTAPELRVPTLATVVDEVARGRVVVAMRYHAAIAGVLGGRPVVGIGYSPKVTALADDLQAGARLLRWDAEELAGLADAVETVLGQDEAVEAGYERLAARGVGNRQVLERLLAAAS
jgi:polysaccharide pyruvyl transferase CsaB